jgi:hypothetical protein
LNLRRITRNFKLDGEVFWQPFRVDFRMHRILALRPVRVSPKDFNANGRGHDVIQFSKSVFVNFADVLAHATRSGHDVVIADHGDSLTLKHTKLSVLDKSDFHFA